MIDTNGGVDDTDGYDSDYDRVTAHDIADLLHHLAELRNAGTTSPSSIPPNGLRSSPARPICSPASPSRPNTPASTPTASRSGRWPTPHAPPPTTSSPNSRSSDWGQLRGELPTVRPPRVGPDQQENCPVPSDLIPCQWI